MSPTNYIPKEATQQSEFLKKYPEYDGRGITIAIIDSDVVDKNLPGMQTTSTGLPKIIDCLGKFVVTVDTSAVVKRNGKNFIIGLSGRKLKIPSKWKNPSDKWHLGSNTFEQLYNEKRENKDTDESDTNLFHDKIFDCIVWFDGRKWRACIDTSTAKCFSNLEHAKVLTNFGDESKVAYFPNQKPYSLKISDDGNLLEVFYPHHDHATLVSHVAAGYFPDKPESNGLAPGAQIVSMHSRYKADILDNMLLKCIEFGVDIVNFSVGFDVTPSIIQIINKMINEHGIIITMAASNDGPFLSSMCKEYTEIYEQVFVIGAMYDSEMKEKFCYFESANSVYGFSSKGPLISSGARGIDFVAPGAAVTDLPKWCAKKKERHQGTSFAAPNVAGSIACLLSALKANKISYSPSLIKLALANSAFLPEGADKLSYGHGNERADFKIAGRSAARGATFLRKF